MNRLILVLLLGVTFFITIIIIIMGLALAYCLVNGYDIDLAILKLAMQHAIKGGVIGGVAMIILGCVSIRYRKRH